MTDIFVNALVAFVGVLVFMFVVAVALMGLFVLIVTRKDDRPIELSPRAGALCAICTAAIVAWQLVAMFTGMVTQ